MVRTAPRSLLALPALFAALALSACMTDRGATTSSDGAQPNGGQASDETPDAEPDAADVGTTPALEEGPLLTDAEIAGVAAAIHEGEISHARIVRERSQTREVRVFADTMVREHTRALDELLGLPETARVVPQPSTLQQELTAQSLAMEQDLVARDPLELDQAYLQGQVTMHERALQLADEQLIPSAQSAELRAYLLRMRPLLTTHLEMARTLLQQQSVALR